MSKETQMTEIMVPINYFLQRTKDFPDNEIVAFLKKVGWSKHTTELQLLMIKELFMPWQLAEIARAIGHVELERRLNKEEGWRENEEWTHAEYMKWSDHTVKNYCKERRHEA